MSSQAAELVAGLGLELPLPGTVESWLLDTMDHQLAFLTAQIAVSSDTEVVAVLRSMLRLMPSPIQPVMASRWKELRFTAHTFRALAVLN